MIHRATDGCELLCFIGQQRQNIFHQILVKEALNQFKQLMATDKDLCVLYYVITNQ